ncbi:MAG: hypothetical protein RQ723_04805 [Desulfuromonadales bacterium]|nr:hypothetical protein [Desulfuromonadales bacterium]
MKRQILTGLLTLLLALPTAALAMSHADHAGHDDAAKQHDDHSKHSGHAMQADHDTHSGHESHADQDSHDLKLIGEKIEKGVKATVKVLVYDADKAALTNASHHLMVFFTDAKTGAERAEGTVAVKVEGKGRDDKPVALMAMDGGFGTDLRVTPGHYELEIGTRLADGEKRKFELMWMVE